MPERFDSSRKSPTKPDWCAQIRWAYFQRIAVHALPETPGFWRSLERAFRYHRKRQRGGLGITAVSSPAAINPPNGPATFAIYFNYQGSYFYHEMALLLQAGLTCAGHVCQLRTQRDGPAPDAKCHLVIAPHEFFYLADGWNCFARSHHGTLFILNTEPPGTARFAAAARTFFLAQHVFDMSADSARYLQDQGYSASHLRFGFVDGFSLYDGNRPLPLMPETEAFPAAVRHWHDADLTLARRPLDLCFFGEATTRRARRLAALAPWLQGVESYLRLKPPGGEPWSAAPPGQDHHTRLSAGIARRSKILLNLHRTEDPYFEWHRIVLMGLWQRTLVVTEPVTSSAPFVAGQDFVQAPVGDLRRTLDYYLRDPGGVAEAERISQQGHRTLREACDFSQHLREAWQPFV